MLEKASKHLRNPKLIRFHLCHVICFIALIYSYFGLPNPYNYFLCKIGLFNIAIQGGVYIILWAVLQKIFLETGSGVVRPRWDFVFTITEVLAFLIAALFLFIMTVVTIGALIPNGTPQAALSLLFWISAIPYSLICCYLLPDKLLTKKISTYVIFFFAVSLALWRVLINPVLPAIFFVLSSLIFALLSLIPRLKAIRLSTRCINASVMLFLFVSAATSVYLVCLPDDSQAAQTWTKTTKQISQIDRSQPIEESPVSSASTDSFVRTGYSGPGSSLLFDDTQSPLVFFRQKFANETSMREFIDLAASHYDVPSSLMMAYAKAESALNPWAVNVEGKVYQPASAAEALRIVQNNSGASFDIGLMQINVQWMKKFNISPDEMIKPETNTKFAAWLINKNLTAFGSNWKGLAAYHTDPDKNPDRARKYMHSVARYLTPSVKTEKTAPTVDTVAVETQPSPANELTGNWVKYTRSSSVESSVTQ